MFDYSRITEVPRNLDDLSNYEGIDGQSLNVLAHLFGIPNYLTFTIPLTRCAYPNLSADIFGSEDV